MSVSPYLDLTTSKCDSTGHIGLSPNPREFFVNGFDKQFLPKSVTPIHGRIHRSGTVLFHLGHADLDSGQKDTERRAKRIAANEMTQHRLDVIYPAINRAKTKVEVADILYQVIEKAGLKSSGHDDANRTDYWILFTLQNGPYFGQCGERSRLFERMLVMLGIDGRHVHTFIPHVSWAINDPALGPKGRRLKFPSGLQNYCIEYVDNIGRNQGEGCLALATDTIPDGFGKLDDAVGFSTDSVRRKYIFGKFYGMLTGGNITADYDAANELTGGYGVLLKLDFQRFLTVVNNFDYGRYKGWINDELPRP